MKKITPHGHIEERLKTLRKFECVSIRQPRKWQRILAEEFDVTGEWYCLPLYIAMYNIYQHIFGF